MDLTITSHTSGLSLTAQQPANNIVRGTTQALSLIMPQEVVALAIMGIDQHENGIMAVSRVLMESQIQVEYLGTCQTPESIVEQAVALNADVIGISCHSWEYLTLVSQRYLRQQPRISTWLRVFAGCQLLEAIDHKPHS